LITGPTPGGIGAETALALAKADPKRLILAGRSQQKIQPLVDQIRKDKPNVEVIFVQLDLGNLSSVRKSVDVIKSILDGDKIDVLIFNAAVMACPYALTVDGYESQFGTNHLGHFLFGNLLLREDLVRSRIVVVSSSASERNAEYAFAPLKDVSYDNGKAYEPFQAYTFSKSCNNLFARRLARVLHPKGIVVFSLNPGSVSTNLQGYMTEDLRIAAVETAKRENPEFEYPKLKTLQQGASTQLRAALDPSLDPESGAYLDDCQVKKPAVLAGHGAFVDEVWELSERLVGEKFQF
jgi:NAD(P)-dependent dehydrogenase (short-subunit alcohol dehydrogenase family)